MRAFKSLHDETVTAEGDISANRFVTYANVQAATLGEKVLGVARYDAVTGDDLAVTTHGVAAAESGGAFNRGDDVTTDAQGRVIAHPGGAEYKIGEALVDCTGAGFFPQIIINR